ncbi:MAG: hypothetical protein IJY25_04930 [Bacilli bacterium]|nr:hypothetical protein [Bacilli bacterium]
MKKIFNIVLINIMTLLLIPNLVSAEEIKIGDYKYIIEESSYKEYICDELEGKDYYIYSVSNKTKVVLQTEEPPLYTYLIDFTKTDNCETITNEEFDKLYFNDVAYDYVWGKDNVIRRAKISYEVSNHYILTEDTSIDNNKVYLKIDDVVVSEVKNPNNEDLSTYYEEIFLKYSYGYDSEMDYYEVEYNCIAKYIGKISEEQYNSGNYYIKEEPELEEVLKLENTDFIVSEKLGIFDEEYRYDRSDYFYIMTFGEETYLAFSDENSGIEVIFDLDGNVIRFGFDDKYQEYLEVTHNDLFAFYSGKSFEDSNIYIIDPDFNVIYEKDSKDNYISYLTTLENTDYFAVESPSDIKILKITKEKIVEQGEPIPNTFDGIATYIILGLVALVGLALSIIFIKKGKKVGSMSSSVGGTKN